MAASYPPRDRPWQDVWQDAYLSALQIGTPEALTMANSQCHLASALIVYLGRLSVCSLSVCLSACAAMSRPRQALQRSS